MHRWNRNEFFSIPAQLRPVLYLHASNDWRRENKGPRELCVPTPVIFGYFSHHLFWDSGKGQSLCDILRTISASEMMVFTTMAVLEAAHYGVRSYSSVQDPR